MYPYKAETEGAEAEYASVRREETISNYGGPITPSFRIPVTANPMQEKAPTPSLAFTTQFASTSHTFDSHTNSGPTTPLHTPTFNAVFYPPSGNRRDSTSELEFEDSPIKVTCRTRGRSTSPYLASLHGEGQNENEMRDGKVFTYNDSERSTPVQATTPNFELISRLALTTPPLDDSDSLPEATANTAVDEGNTMPIEMGTDSGNSIFYTNHFYSSNVTSNLTSLSNRSFPMQPQHIQEEQEQEQQQEWQHTQQNFPVQQTDNNQHNVNVDKVANKLEQQELPASVVHRALHGRCRFIAFPTNLPTVRCRNSPGNIANNNVVATSAPINMMPYANGSRNGYEDMINNTNANNSNNNNNNNNISTLATGYGNVSMNTISPNYINIMNNNEANDKASKKHALFIGQVRFETTPAELIWLVHRCTGACASFLESRGAGCYLLYCKSEADLQLVRTLHKRILFDIGGFWLARTAEEVDALCEHVAIDAPLLSRKAHLPRDSMVVEEVKEDAVSSRHINHHSAFTHGIRNNTISHQFTNINNNINNTSNSISVMHNNNSNKNSIVSNNNTNNGMSVITGMTPVPDIMSGLQPLQTVPQLYTHMPLVNMSSMPNSLPLTTSPMTITQQSSLQQTSLPPPYTYEEREEELSEHYEV